MPIHTCPSCQTTFEVKALPGEHVDYQPPSEPGSQTAVPPGAARVAMSSDTHEYEVAIPDERFKREGGADVWMKGLDPVDAEDDDPLDDVDTEAGPHDASLFAEGDPEAKTVEPEPEPEPVIIGRGSKVTWADGSGTVDLVVVAGILPGVASPLFGTKADPLLRVVQADGSKRAVRSSAVSVA